MSKKLTLSKWAQNLSQLKTKEEKLNEINLNLSKNSLTVLKSRYLKKDEKGEICESPKEAFYRVANHIAKAEKKFGNSEEVAKIVENAFLEILTSLEFLPNSPTFSGAGTDLGQLSACFVLPIEDDMESIMQSLKDAVMIHKSGGGTGFSFSRLRPNGARISTTTGTSPGPVSFIKMYDGTTEQVKQGGTRKGANMGILRVDHPDIMEFIEAKEEEGKINNFNLSVAITDKFMKAVKNDEEYDLYDPHQEKVVDSLDAKKVFNKIAKNAWKNGEPGIFFIDETNRKNPVPHLGEIESTNPCGEQPLMPYESCNLGSINLSKFVKEEEGKKVVDWDRLEYVARLAIRFLDNVIEMNDYPIDEIEKNTKKTRKVGLGVMGFSNMLIKMGLKYNSNEARDLAEKIMSFINKNAHKASEKLAEKRGNFPAYEGSKWDKEGRKMRNAASTTIAPTGTLSLIGNCSPGIEPIFSVAYIRNVLDGERLIDVNPVFEEIAKEKGFYSKELMEEIAKADSLQEFDVIPENVKELFVTAHDIAPEDHIKMQAAFQKGIDNAISKTINFPKSATIDDVKNAYKLAYKLKLKGLTIYRDGSRQEQVMEKKDEDKKKEEGKSEKEAKQALEATVNRKQERAEIEPRDRPDVLVGYTYKTKTSYGSLYITINEDKNNNPFEVFATIGKAGGFFAAKAEAISRMISLSLRSGIKTEKVVEQLKGIRGPSPSFGKNGKIYSLPDAIAQTLERHLKKKTGSRQLNLEEVKEQPKQTVAGKDNQIKLEQSVADNGEAPACPECGAMLEMSEGCMTCQSCGYSKCS